MSNEGAGKKRFIALLSGGIDSPVAVYMMLQKGYEGCAVHFDYSPKGSDLALGKVKKLVSIIKEATGKELPLYVVPHLANQLEFARVCETKYECVLCKRIMMRIAEQLAQGCDASFIITGESLGQVASQTMQNMKAIDSSVKIPIIRPLIGLDKIEIEHMAKKAGTFEASIAPAPPCAVVPRHPVTSADIDKVVKEEARLDMDLLVRNSLDNLKTM